VRGDAAGRCRAAGAFAARRGALVDGRALVPTKDGIAVHEVDRATGSFLDRGVLPGTDEFVDETAKLAAGAGGMVLVALAREVIELGRKP
jgi:hypothetical protein